MQKRVIHTHQAHQAAAHQAAQQAHTHQAQSHPRDEFHSDWCNVVIFVVLVLNKFYILEDIDIVFPYFPSIETNKKRLF